MKNDQYIVLHTAPEDEFTGKETIAFFDTKAEMEALIKELHGKRTKTNQRFSEFAHVFPKGSLYTPNPEAFKKERAERIKQRRAMRLREEGSWYFIQYKHKNGNTFQKFCEWAEDFEFDMEGWIEKGKTDIVILNVLEGYQGDYYYQRDIEKFWGGKDVPLAA